MSLRHSQKLITLLINLLFACLCQAQEFYVCDNLANVRKVTLSGGVCSAVLLPKCTNVNPYTIAIYKDTLYSIDIGLFKRSQIVNGIVTNCVTISNMLPFNALTVDSSGTLYASVGYTLYKIDRFTGATTFLGTMPYSTAGDLIFYRGSLYLAATSPVGGIVKVDITNPALSTIYIPIPNSDILGMVSVPVDCSTNKVYVMNRIGFTTQLIELNMDMQTIANNICTLPFAVYDAASSVETGLYAGVNVQSMQIAPECINRPASGSIRFNTPASAANPYTYLFNNSITNTTGLFTGLAAGHYPIHISSAGGCSLDTFATITVADTPNLQIQVNNAYCGNNNGSIISIASGTLPPYMYALNNGTAQTSGTFGNMGQGSCFLQATDSNRCVSSANMTIQMIYPQINPVITIHPSVCNQVNASITIAAPNSIGYSLNNGPQQASGQFANLTAGTYIVSVFTMQGCRKDTTIIIHTIYPALVQTITVNAATCNQVNGTITVSATTATGYSLNNGTQQPVGQFTNLAPGSYLVSTFTTEGCRYDSLVNINMINSTIVQHIIVSQASCNLGNGAINVSASNAAGHSLNNGTQQISGQFTNLATGSYLVSTFTSGGCRKDTTVTITSTLNPEPSVSITSTTPDCYNRNNGSIFFSVNGAYTPYSISLNGGAFSNRYLFDSLGSGTFRVRIQDAGGCMTDTIAIVPAYVLSKPAFKVSKERPTCLDPQTGSIRLTVTGSVPPYSIVYQNSRYPSAYLFKNLLAGNYFFKINDSMNCSLDSATIPLELIQLKECDTVYVPTAFTPDGNGNNDQFKATAYGTLLNFSMSVYNRFGQPVFRSDEISKAWDGKNKGVQQPGGAYVWMISYRFEGKPERKLKGTVILIR